MTTRARIGAKVGIAQRQLRRSTRTQVSAIESANRRAEEPLDRESDSLMRLWVGDMTKPLNEAKDKLHSIADAPPYDPKAAAAAAAQWSDDDDDGLLSVLQGHGVSVATTTTTTT